MPLKPQTFPLVLLALLGIATNVYSDEQPAKVKLAGEWKTVSSLPNGNELEGILNLSGKNEELGGRIGANEGRPIEKASYKDGSVHFEFEVKRNGRSLPASVDAKPKSANELVGTWTVTLPMREMSGEWRATRTPNADWKFVHLFYFKFKDDVPEEEMAALMKELAGLKKKIPVLKELVVGKNVARRTHGFQYGQISVFDKPEDLEAYEKHPEHGKVAKKIIPKLVHGVSVDFVPTG